MELSFAEGSTNAVNCLSLVLHHLKLTYSQLLQKNLFPRRNLLVTSFFAEADADTSAAADKFNAACFERLLDRGKRGFAGLNRLALDHVKGDNGEAGFRRQGRLRPFQ
jgi:hypothetical protein